ncbi:MAG: L-erythro-3,5-diaminohexanoate dehydrogenase [Halanaerobiales bacterium]
MKKGNRYGVHRVIEPKGSLPQPAWKIDNTMKLYDNEIMVDIKTLNIDSASFTQIKKETDGSEKKIKERMKEIVAKRGKHHNPVTGSGGMFIGNVREIGPALADRDLRVGDKIASLVSLSLTPLQIDEIIKVNKDTDQVHIRGKAILFESGIYARLPEDMSQTLALAVLDVAGAPAQTAKLVEPGDKVLVIGAGGKSGLLSLYQARKQAGITGQVIALEYNDKGCERIKNLELADVVLQGDATKSVEIYEMVEEATEDRLCDVVINNVNIPGTEMASIMSTRDGGVIYFFSMATSFTRAALGAEGIGRDVEMIIGNGYTRGHAAIALQTVRESASIRELFDKLYTG